MTSDSRSSNLDSMEILGSARKHGIEDHDIRHATAYMMILHDLDDYDMIVGPTRAGMLIEVGISHDSRVFHAMSARRRFLPGKKR